MKKPARTLQTDCLKPAFLTACVQFNQGDYFDCHETLEDHCWRPCNDKTDTSFFQGLIQLAVARHHAANHNLTGARRLCDKALSHLVPLSQSKQLTKSAMHWLNLTQLVTDTLAWQSQINNMSLITNSPPKNDELLFIVLI